MSTSIFDDACGVVRGLGFERRFGAEHLGAGESLLVEERAEGAVAEGDEQQLGGGVAERTVVVGFVDVDLRASSGGEDDSPAILVLGVHGRHGRS